MNNVLLQGNCCAGWKAHRSIVIRVQDFDHDLRVASVRICDCSSSILGHQSEVVYGTVLIV